LLLLKVLVMAQDDELKGWYDRFQRGDDEAFKFFYYYYIKRLLPLVHGLVGQRELAEEIVEDAFVKLHFGRKLIRDAAHVYSFLYVVARNMAISHLRHQRSLRAAAREQERLADKADVDPLELELEMAASVEQICQLVEKLPPERKRIVKLYFFEQLSVRDIANRLNLSESTVRNQRNRALDFIRKYFLR
jgi:RNA polymerase sigma factor (sigma-70 family)